MFLQRTVKLYVVAGERAYLVVHDYLALWVPLLRLSRKKCLKMTSGLSRPRHGPPFHDCPSPVDLSSLKQGYPTLECEHCNGDFLKSFTVNHNLPINDAKLNRQRFWHCYENILIKAMSTVPTICGLQ